MSQTLQHDGHIKLDDIMDSLATYSNETEQRETILHFCGYLTGYCQGLGLKEEPLESRVQFSEEGNPAKHSVSSTFDTQYGQITVSALFENGDDFKWVAESLINSLQRELGERITSSIRKEVLAKNTAKHTKDVTESYIAKAVQERLGSFPGWHVKQVAIEDPTVHATLEGKFCVAIYIDPPVGSQRKGHCVHVHAVPQGVLYGEIGDFVVTELSKYIKPVGIAAGASPGYIDRSRT